MSLAGDTFGRIVVGVEGRFERRFESIGIGFLGRVQVLVLASGSGALVIVDRVVLEADLLAS